MSRHNPFRRYLKQLIKDLSRKWVDSIDIAQAFGDAPTYSELCNIRQRLLDVYLASYGLAARFEDVTKLLRFSKSKPLIKSNLFFKLGKVAKKQGKLVRINDIVDSILNNKDPRKINFVTHIERDLIHGFEQLNYDLREGIYEIHRTS